MEEEGNIKLNKAVTIYILITFGALWYLLATVNEVVVISSFLYIAVIISTGLMVTSILISDTFRNIAAKTREAAAAVKQKSIQTAANVKLKAGVVLKKSTKN